VSLRVSFFVAAAVLLLAVPLATLAQQPQRIPRIGFLSLQSLKTDSRLPAFIAGMRERGYVEGQTITIEWRSADGDATRLAAYAEELVRLKVELIVAAQPQAIEAARRVTGTIPIVFAVAQDPVASGYAKSLARPGGSITGVSLVTPDIAPKQVELLKIVLPNLARVAVLVNRTNTGSPVQVKAIQETANRVDVAVQVYYASTREEVEQALAAAGREGAQALILSGDSFFFQVRAVIAEAAMRHRLPTMFVQREHVVAGGMISYGPSVSENYRRSAYYVERILKGAKASELPIEQPTKIELVINLKTAKALGIAMSQSFLLRADELIQ